MDRARAWMTADLAAALLGLLVGAVIGVRVGLGAVTSHDLFLMGVSVLGVIQLRLLLEPSREPAATRP